jgi:hypothetical protein
MRLFTLLCLCSVTAFAETELPWFDNSRLSLDLTSRSSYWQKESQFVQQEFLGLDYYQVLSIDNTELGQLTLQPFLYRIDNGYRTAAIYDDDHDWEFVVRTATLNYNAWGLDKPYIKVGHFEIPFGVEFSKDTFGDLHQYGQGMKMGMKMDWGIALGQELNEYKYEISATRGSGMKYRDEGDPFAYAGRISTLNDSQWALGTSLFYGEIIDKDTTSERSAIAIDFEYFYNTHGVIFEIYTGQQNEKDIWGSLVEFNSQSQDESKEVYLQHFYKKMGSQTAYSALVAGISYRLSKELTISNQIKKELESINTQETLFELQLRYRF